MQIELGQQLRCSDGPGGRVGDVVVDPVRPRVTHLVAQPHDDHRQARLVPAELVSDTGGDALTLGCTMAELERLPTVEEFAYRRFGEPDTKDPNWDPGITTILVPPRGFGLADWNPYDLDPRVAFVYDRVPKGDVEIRRASTVVSADGRLVGHVRAFVVDRHDRITDVVLEQRRWFRRRRLTVPVSAVGRLGNDCVSLDVSRDDVERAAGKLAALSP